MKDLFKLDAVVAGCPLYIECESEEANASVEIASFFLYELTKGSIFMQKRADPEADPPGER